MVTNYIFNDFETYLDISMFYRFEIVVLFKYNILFYIFFFESVWE